MTGALELEGARIDAAARVIGAAVLPFGNWGAQSEAVRADLRRLVVRVLAAYDAAGWCQLCDADQDRNQTAHALEAGHAGLCCRCAVLEGARC